MKKLSIILTVLFIVISGAISNIYAQYDDNEESFLYYELGTGFEKFNNWHIGFNKKFNSNDLISGVFNYHIRLTPQLPGDFIPEYSTWIGNLPIPRQSFALFSMMYGKVFYTPSRFIRFVARSGFVVGRCDQSVDFKPAEIIVTGGFLGGDRTSNYTFKEQILTVTGIVINPTIEMPLLRGLGLNIGVYGNINNVASIYGLDASILIGQLRDRKVKSDEMQ